MEIGIFFCEIISNITILNIHSNLYYYYYKLLFL